MSPPLHSSVRICMKSCSNRQSRTTRSSAHLGNKLGPPCKHKCWRSSHYFLAATTSTRHSQCILVASERRLAAMSKPTRSSFTILESRFCTALGQKGSRGLPFRLVCKNTDRRTRMHVDPFRKLCPATKVPTRFFAALK